MVVPERFAVAAGGWVRVDAFDEERRYLQFSELLLLNGIGLTVRVQSRERCVRHTEGEVRSQVHHEISSDQRLLWNGEERLSRVLDGALGQKHLGVRRHVDLA